MKRVLGFAVFASVLLSGVSADAQLQKLTMRLGESGQVDPQTVEVPEGKTLEVVYYSVYDGAPILKIDGFRFNHDQDPRGLILPGPASLELSVLPASNPTATFNAILIYRLTDNAPDGAQSSPFSGSAVVIPEDASGPVQIVLESSTDLVNWTPANPGTYGSSTEKRFFRVRAEVETGN